jgi:hypothetical protein
MEKSFANITEKDLVPSSLVEAKRILLYAQLSEVLATAKTLPDCRLKIGVLADLRDAMGMEICEILRIKVSPEVVAKAVAKVEAPPSSALR